ncbi:hypothetical protein ACLB2K_015660 [Fragaria x ananassa]
MSLPDNLRRGGDLVAEADEDERGAEGFALHAAAAHSPPIFNRLALQHSPSQRRGLAGQPLAGEAEQGEDFAVRISPLMHVPLLVESNRVNLVKLNSVPMLLALSKAPGSAGRLYSEATHKNCVAALYALSHGSMRFRGLAREAKAVEVLSEIEKRGSERAREKAKRLLMIMRGNGGGRPEDGGMDWKEVLDGGVE